MKTGHIGHIETQPPQNPQQCPASSTFKASKMFTPINASKAATGRKPLPAFRKDSENKILTTSTDTPTPARLGKAQGTTTTTSSSSFGATSITPSWASKYEQGRLGDLLIPLEAGKPQDLRSYFRGNGKMECPVYNGKKPSWAYVHYVLLSLVPGGKVQSNVLYEMGIEWIPELEKKVVVTEDGKEKKQRKNQSCGSALTRGPEFVCALDEKGEKTKFWCLADKGSADGESKAKKRKMKEKNGLEDSSSMPGKPAAKKVKDHHPAMPIRTTLKGKSEDARIPEGAKVPTQDGTLNETTKASSSSPLAKHQDPGCEGFELVAHEERKSNPDNEIHKSTQPPPSPLPSATNPSHEHVHDEKKFNPDEEIHNSTQTPPSPLPPPTPNPTPSQPQNLPPIAHLLDAAGIHQLLAAATAVILSDLPPQPGYPGVAVGPHPYGTPAALPNAGQALLEIADRADARRDVSTEGHRATDSRVTVADADPDPNEWFPRSAREREVAGILADMRMGR